jgi:hypothetical protein
MSPPTAQAHPTPQVEGSALDRFELACVSRQLDEAMQLALAALHELRDYDTQIAPPSAEERAALARDATRFVSAWIALLLDPTFRVTQEIFTRVVLYLDDIRRLYLISGFGGTDHALDLAAKLSGKPLRGAELADRLRFHLLFTMDSRVPDEAPDVFNEHPGLALLLVLALFANRPIATLAGHERRERLVENVDRLRPSRLPGTTNHMVLLSIAWMGVSYASHRRKHEFKRVFNAVAREWTLRLGLRDADLPTPRARPERPRMVVASERMRSDHVQYRYFGQWLRQLRQRFELILVTEKQEIDEPVRALFDDVHGFGRDGQGRYLREAADTIAGMKPDLIFYPSVGMRHWGVVLGNVRLAPIQFTALGHSASTFCPTIDYFVIERGYVGDPSLLTEKLILLEDEDLFFERTPGYRPLAPNLREKPDVLRIALAANLLKLNPAFLHVCAAIAKNSRRPLEFHLFPGVAGLQWEAACRTMTKIVPNATVHRYSTYMDYLRALNECDLSLSPWPFGSLHSVVDALRQGVPVVAMVGHEPHSCTDSLVIHRVGMPEWLLCRDQASYIATALRVIEDDKLRLDLSRQALACDIDKRLFGDATTPLDRGVVDAIWGMYRHHEAIQADGRQCFSREDLAKFGE